MEVRQVTMVRSLILSTIRFLIPSQFTISVWEELWPRRPFGGGKRIWVEWRQSSLVQVEKIRPTIAEQITYIGSNSEGIGTTGRGARPRQNCCQSAKLTPVSVGHKVLARATTATNSSRESEPNEPLWVAPPRVWARESR